MNIIYEYFIITVFLLLLYLYFTEPEPMYIINKKREKFSCNY